MKPGPYGARPQRKRNRPGRNRSEIMQVAIDQYSAAAGCRRLGRMEWTRRMIMRMMRTFGRAALGFAVATLMSVAPARAVDTVTIGTVGSPSANLWPLFIGIDKGFFTAENIKADLIYIPASAPAIQQLAAGSLDMSFSTRV